MPTATFDTLKFANTLKAAGVPAAQAEAQAVAFAEVIQLNFKDLATKEDVGRLGQELRAELKLETSQIRGELTLLKWMLGVVLTLSTGIAVRLFFFR